MSTPTLCRSQTQVQSQGCWFVQGQPYVLCREWGSWTIIPSAHFQRDLSSAHTYDRARADAKTARTWLQSRGLLYATFPTRARTLDALSMALVSVPPPWSTL